jgi:hypothetical protein
LRDGGNRGILHATASNGEISMSILRVAAALCAAFASTALMAQSDQPSGRSTTVAYKCVNADGSVVYSESPCSADPKKVQTIDTSNALRAGSGGHIDEIAEGVATSDCRTKAYESTHNGMDAKVSESNTHIADYRKRQEELQQQAGYLAEAELRRQAEELDAAIARESEFQQKEAVNVELAYQDALKACDLSRGASDGAAPLRASTPPPPALEAPAPAPAPADNGGG